MHILNSYTLTRFSKLLILEGSSRISQLKLLESPLKPAAYILKSTHNCSPYYFILMYTPYSHCPQFQFLFAPFPFCGLWVKLVCPLPRQGFQPPGCSASPVLHQLSVWSVSFFQFFLQRQLPRALCSISHETSPQHLAQQYSYSALLWKGLHWHCIQLALPVTHCSTLVFTFSEPSGSSSLPKCLLFPKYNEILSPAALHFTPLLLCDYSVLLVEIQIPLFM